MYNNRLNCKTRRVCRLKVEINKISFLNEFEEKLQSRRAMRRLKPNKSFRSASPKSRPATPSSKSSDLLQSFGWKDMDSDAQLELLQTMIDNHRLKFDQFRALYKLIGHRMKFDIISNVPVEIASYIISFLSPRDLCQAAQTCRFWRVICEDNRLWREKCKEEGLMDNEITIETLFKKRISKNHANQEGSANESLSNIPRSEWKTAYLKHMSILRNWRVRRFEISSSFLAPGPNQSLQFEGRTSDADRDDSLHENVKRAKHSSDTAQRIIRRSSRLNDPSNIPNDDAIYEYYGTPINPAPASSGPKSNPHLMQLRCHEESVITCLQYNPKSNIVVSGSDDQTLKVWSSETGRCLTTLEGHAGGVWSSQLSPDDIVISGSTDRTLRVWDAHTGKLYHTLYGHTSTVRCLALNGNQVVSGSRDTTLRLWNINTGDCIHVFSGHTAAVRCVEYKDDIIVSGAYDCLVMVWDAKTGCCIHSLANHSNRIYSIQFDGRLIASGSLDTTICIWDVTTGQLRHRLEGHNSLTSKMQLRGNLLVSANADSYCKIWDVSTGKCLHTLGGANKHTSAITSVFFNNRHVVTSSDDGTVKLWDLSTGKFIRNLVEVPKASNGGVVWRIRASYTKLICAIGSRLPPDETHLLVLDFDE